MTDSSYWLAGKVDVPEAKKQEFNACVMEILKRFGMRKRKEIGKIIILAKPTPDENGIVEFDYSIFEKKDRTISIYNMNTCKLYSVDRGSHEYGLAINCILLLQECYSNGSCFFMTKREPVDVYGYMRLLSTVLNRKIYNSGREKMWDMLLLLRKDPNADLPTIKDIFQRIFPFGYSEFQDFQLLSILATDQTEPPTTDKEPITNRTQIARATHMSRIEYLYRIMAKQYQLDKKALVDYLNELLCLPLASRKKLSEQDDDLSTIAELSLYLPPACFVSSFALLEGRSFWDEWDMFITKDYYTDIISEDKKKKLSEDFEKMTFYKNIHRKNEDEFLEFWDGENLILSDEMKDRIQTWKQLVDMQEDKPDLQVKSYLEETIMYIDKEWSCRYIDEEFVKKILENQNDPEWRKVLLVLRRIVDEGLELFPEMNREMAVLWLKPYRRKFDSISIAAYCSLMENDVARQCVFGF